MCLPVVPALAETVVLFQTVSSPQVLFAEGINEPEGFCSQQSSRHVPQLHFSPVPESLGELVKIADSKPTLMGACQRDTAAD